MQGKSNNAQYTSINSHPANVARCSNEWCNVRVITHSILVLIQVYAAFDLAGKQGLSGQVGSQGIVPKIQPDIGVNYFTFKLKIHKVQYKPYDIVRC